MRFDGLPDDLRINPFAFGIGAGANLFAGGGLVLVRHEVDLTDTSKLTNGSAQNISFCSLNSLGYSEFIITNAFYCVKGFAGGSGGVDFSLGISAASYNDLVLVSNIAPGAGTTVRGTTPTESGTRLAVGTAFEYEYDNSPIITLRIDATLHTGTVTAGRCIVAITILPLDGFNNVVA